MSLIISHSFLRVNGLLRTWLRGPKPLVSDPLGGYANGVEKSRWWVSGLGGIQAAHTNGEKRGRGGGRGPRRSGERLKKTPDPF